MVGPLSMGIAHRYNGQSLRIWVLYGRVDAMLRVSAG